MPVRNGARYLAEAVKSILAQRLGDLELIVVDDGSTDDSRAIAAAFAAADPRVRIMVGAGAGIVAALQVGVTAATAPLIARMDADDIALPDRLAAQCHYLANRPRSVAIGGQVARIDSSGRPIGFGRYPIGPANCRAYLRRGSPFCHPAVTLRADALARCGGYRDRYGGAEDYDLWLRLAAQGDIDNLPVTVLRYRLHGDNLTLRKAAQNARDAALAYLEAFYPDAAAAIPVTTHGPAGWEAVEPELPETLRLAGRLAYLRMLALNGGIVDRAAATLLFDSVGPLRREARRLGTSREFAFSLLRAAIQFRRNRDYGASARLAALACAVSPGEAARTLTALLARGGRRSA